MARKLYLNIVEKSLAESPARNDRPDRVRVPLGEHSLSVVIVGDLLTEGYTLEFAAKKTVTAGSADYDTTALVTGSAEITEDPKGAQALDLEEDWRAAALVALFTGDEVSKTLKGQYRWRHEDWDAGVYEYSELITFEVLNSLFTEAVIPGAAVVAAPLLYLSNISRLTGAAPATDLDAVPTVLVSIGTIVQVVVDGTALQWKLVAGIDAEDAIVVVRPDDFNASTNAKVWKRVAG